MLLANLERSNTFGNSEKIHIQNNGNTSDKMLKAVSKNSKP